MRFNETIEYEITDDLSAEPVTVADVKRHLNLLFDTDGSYSFGDDDTLIEGLITASRKYLEEYTGLSFGEKTIIAVLRNELGEIEIPYGPIVEIVSVKNADGEELTADTDYKLQGRKYPKLVCPCASYVEIEYTAGFATLPADLKQAVIVEAAWRYHHRFDEMDANAYCRQSLELCASLKRSPWLA